MTDIAELKSWIAHAEDDFAAAKTLMRQKKPLLYSASFHAQQCAEKYMKALLIFRDQDFPKVHDLGTLSSLCANAGIILGISEETLDTLSAYAISTRYPGTDPNLEETKEAIEITKSIRKFARSFLGLEK
jgi:HEPN domain-containing protein